MMEIALQSGLTDMVAQNAPQLAAIVLAYVAGAATPFAYLIERLRGFGRASVAKLPYKSPPGMEKEQALQRATSAVDSDEGDPWRNRPNPGAGDGSAGDSGGGS